MSIQSLSKLCLTTKFVERVPVDKMERIEPGKVSYIAVHGVKHSQKINFGWSTIVP